MVLDVLRKDITGIGKKAFAQGSVYGRIQLILCIKENPDAKEYEHRRKTQELYYEKHYKMGNL